MQVAIFYVQISASHFPLLPTFVLKVCSPKPRINPTFPLLSLEEVGSGMGIGGLNL